MKKISLWAVGFLLLIFLAGVLFLDTDRASLMVAQHKASYAEIEIAPASLKVFQPLPAVLAADQNPLTEAKIQLGRMLYYDARLSRDGKISCNTCHNLSQYGTDHERVSTGFKGQQGTRNSPTVYNAANQVAQFWDGRAADVEEQAKGPVLNPVEMAMPSPEAVVKVLSSIPGYVQAFQEAFPGEKNPVTYDNVGKAIGAFERKLVTPSRWDKYLTGDLTALTNVEKIGFNQFMDAGCQMCHSGAYVGGSTYMKLGVMKPWPDTADLGRFDVTHHDADKLKFKVPTLRNIAKTGPYFHNGSVPTLDQAVKDMGEFQLGKSLSNDQIKYIVVWLNTLTGDIPAEYIKPPELPKGT